MGSKVVTWETNEDSRGCHLVQRDIQPVTCAQGEGGNQGGLFRNIVRFEVKSKLEAKKQLKQRCLLRKFTLEWSYLIKLGYKGHNGFKEEKLVFLPKICQFTACSDEAK